MRLIRVPYFYLPTAHVRALYLSSCRLLRIVHDIHKGIPNEDWNHPQVKVFMYHPSFLRWVFIKSKQELIKRNVNAIQVLGDTLLGLRSRPLKEFVPPTDAEIAEDVVWLLEKWKVRLLPGGQKLPIDYVELAKKFYDYSPREAAIQRIAEVPGGHRDSDRGWYQLQGEEETQVCGRQMGEDIRSDRHGRR